MREPAGAEDDNAGVEADILGTIQDTTETVLNTADADLDSAAVMAELDLDSAAVKGDLDLDSAAVTGDLDLDSAAVTGDLDLDSAAVTGELDLDSAAVTGELDLDLVAGLAELDLEPAAVTSDIALDSVITAQQIAPIDAPTLLEDHEEGGSFEPLYTLLEDEIFVDFFNTFISLPVFGQIPLYHLKGNHWELYPDLTPTLVMNVDGLVRWLEESRLPFFFKTDLYLHFVLCKSIMGLNTFLSKEFERKIRQQQANEPMPEIDDGTLSFCLSMGLKPLEILHLKTEGITQEEKRCSPFDASIDFFSNVTAEESADRWLLRKCIGSSRGMKRFRSFLKGTPGEDLVEFWMRVERIQELDETNVQHRNEYFSQLRTIQATHLQDGSAVMTTCAGYIESPLNWSKPCKSYKTRKQLLMKMQDRALDKLKHYWLPRFLTHCKCSLEKVAECNSILQTYKEKASKEVPSACIAEYSVSRMIIKKSEDVQGPYSTKTNKRLIWKLPYCIEKVEQNDSTFPKEPENQQTKAHQECSSKPSKPKAVSDLMNASVSRKDSSRYFSHFPGWTTCSSLVKDVSVCRPAAKVSATPLLHCTPVASRASQIDLQEFVLPQLDSNSPVIKAASTIQIKEILEFPIDYEYLHWAFDADQSAAGVFEDFLKQNKHFAQVSFLNLWHELNNLSHVILQMKDQSGFLLRKMLGDKIVQVYLRKGSEQYVKLSHQTTRHLKSLIPSGTVMPWIMAAKKEICEVLRGLYDQFLDEEDKQFLDFLIGKKRRESMLSEPLCVNQEVTPDEAAEHPRSKRMFEALLLAQACSSSGDQEPLSVEDWKVLAQEDPGKGGSVELPTSYRDVTDQTSLIRRESEEEAESSSELGQALKIIKKRRRLLSGKMTPKSGNLTPKSGMGSPWSETGTSGWSRTGSSSPGSGIVWPGSRYRSPESGSDWPGSGILSPLSRKEVSSGEGESSVPEKAPAIP